MSRSTCISSFFVRSSLLETFLVVCPGAKVEAATIKEPITSKRFINSFILQPSALSPSRMRHLFRLVILVKRFARQKSKLNCRLAQGDAFLVSVLGNLRGVVVTDVWIQSRDEHERILQVLVNLRAVEFDTGNAVVNKAVTGVFDEANRMEQIVNHDRIEDVQLEVALRACEPNRGVVAEDLYGDHRHRFTLRRVDL